jgi:hypothetical protein
MALASTVSLGSEYHGTCDHILLPNGSRTFQTLISPDLESLKFSYTLTCTYVCMYVCM